MKSILLLLLFPCLAFSQATKGDYDIYSKYLKVFQANKKVEKICFVVNETTAYSQKYFLPDVDQVVTDLTGYLKGDQTLLSEVSFTFRDVIHTLTKDTLWIPVIAELSQKIKQNFKIENNFSSDLQTIVIGNNTAKKYFRHSKTVKQIDRNWVRFHRKYPMPSALIELSEIASDGQRAVFYFSTRCGGLCGDSDLIFFSKENGEWKFLAKAPLWYN
ncbi:MAG: hypothetical protein ACHQIM_00880 [Sphingobacteriales bacterium]